MVFDILDVIIAVLLSCGVLVCERQVVSRRIWCIPFGSCYYIFLAYLSISASVLTLAIMTIDRYFAIVRPMRRPLSVCPPRWIENIHDSHNITMFEMVIRFVLLYLVSLLPMAMFYSEIALHFWKRKAPGLHIDKNQKRIEKQKRWSQFLSP